MSAKSKALLGYAYSDRALKYLETLNKKQRAQIITKIETLADNPTPSGSKLIKSTAGDVERIYRIRSGDYRVLYVVRNSPTRVVVLDIGHRKDIYK